MCEKDCLDKGFEALGSRFKVMKAYYKVLTDPEKVQRKNNIQTKIEEEEEQNTVSSQFPEFMFTSKPASEQGVNTPRLYLGNRNSSMTQNKFRSPSTRNI